MFTKNPAFDAELKRRIAQGVEEAGKEYVGSLVRTIDDAPRGGVNLNRFGRPRSAPSEVFASETGKLRGSIALERASYSVIKVVITDADAREYAGYLEMGTRKMAARPTFTPVLLQKVPDMLTAFQRGFRS